MLGHAACGTPHLPQRLCPLLLELLVAGRTALHTLPYTVRLIGCAIRMHYRLACTGTMQDAYDGHVKARVPDGDQSQQNHTQLFFLVHPAYLFLTVLRTFGCHGRVEHRRYTGDEYVLM